MLVREQEGDRDFESERGINQTREDARRQGRVRARGPVRRFNVRLKLGHDGIPQQAVL